MVSIAGRRSEGLKLSQDSTPNVLDEHMLDWTFLDAWIRLGKYVKKGTDAGINNQFSYSHLKLSHSTDILISHNQNVF